MWWNFIGRSGEEIVDYAEQWNGESERFGAVVGYAYDAEQHLFRVSVTDSRAKTRNLRADPRLTLHVASKDFWTWVAVEGTAELTPVAADPHDATVEELVTYYRGINGEHENWDEYRAAMVADRRLVVRFRPEHVYGQLPR